MKNELIFLLFIILLILSITNCRNDNRNGNCEDVDTVTDILPGGSISLTGATLNDGINIDDSKHIIFGFNRTLASVDTEVTLWMPAGTNQFTAKKDGSDCYTDGATDCTGSLIVVADSGPDGAILILDFGETAGTSLFSFGVEPVSYSSIENCDWEIDPPVTNADIQFVRAMPEITLTYTETVYSGECFTINAHATADAEPSDYSPAPAFSYSWVQISGPAVFVGEWNNPTIIFDAPEVYMDAEMTFLLTVTDDLDLTTTASVTITILASQKQ